MIYLFRIISDEDQGFYRDLVIDGSDTFFDFHQTLQENLGYDSTQLSSFFITNEMWEKQQEITLIDMMQEPGISAITMENATIGEYVTGLNQKMIYVFDFFSERAFFIEVIEMSEQVSPKPTPFMGQGHGEAPPQLAIDLIGDESGEVSGNGDQWLWDDDISLEDLDPDLLGGDSPEES